MATETSSNRPSEAPDTVAPAWPPAAQLAAAILLPPLALFLLQGVSRDFWIAFGLTCLGYLPGVAFALFTLLKGRSPSGAAA